MNIVHSSARTAWFATVFSLLLGLGATAVSREEMDDSASRLTFHVIQGARFSFSDVVGERIQRNVEHWLLTVPDANPGLLEMFRVRDRVPRPQLVPWAGEFIGKYLISAIQARRMTSDERLNALVAAVVKELISTQAEDGYLGPFTREERLLGHWDLWGHYHVMSALLMQYEDAGDQAAFECAIRAADLICSIYLDGERRPRNAGSTEMNLSVIHVFGKLYRRTGNERYLRMMQTILEDWESPEAGDYYRQALAGVPFYKMPKPRWESLHAIQGLVELHCITGEESYKNAFAHLWRTIQEYDLHNSGAFSTNEQAIGSPYGIGAVETCCQVAWTAMSIDMLALTGDVHAADELERGFWNAILAYQHPSGRWSTYHTPSNGVREASAHSIVFQARHGTPELNCCSVNAPRGLGMLSEWAVMMTNDNGVVVNYYGPMEAEIPLQEGRTLRIRQETNFPRDGKVRIRLDLDTPTDFNLLLRIPAWSANTRIGVNDAPAESITTGAYHSLARTWQRGDVVEVELDMQFRTWVGDEAREGCLSVYYGPLLLAFDQKRNALDTESISPLNFSSLTFEPMPLGEERFAPILLFSVPAADGVPLTLCDFAHAGAYGTHYASWLPAVNMPPPSFRLKSPESQGTAPVGPILFQWQGPAHAENKRYALMLSKSETMQPLWKTKDNLPGCSLLLDPELASGESCYWNVQAHNDYGAVEALDGPRSFRVDGTLDNLYLLHPGLVAYREDGLVAGAYLNGDGKPVYGYLDASVNIVAAEDRMGRTAGAVQLNGNGMLRYKIPEFPHRTCTMMLWCRPEGEAVSRIRQLFSAWARSMDDPLRVYLKESRLIAGIEGGGNAGTEGIEIPFEEWTHIAVVKDGGTLSVYLNGELKQQAVAPESLRATEATTVAIGANPNYSGDEYFAGRLDDFALYARAFKADQIQSVYGAGLDLTGKEK